MIYIFLLTNLKSILSRFTRINLFYLGTCGRKIKTSLEDLDSFYSSLILVYSDFTHESRKVSLPVLDLKV